MSFIHLEVAMLQYMHFQFDYLCSVTTAVVQYACSMKQPDLYYFEATKMMSQA